MSINLTNIKHNVPKPPRIIIHGDAGIGKTTFAACSNNPIFIQTEDGLGNLDVPAFPLARTFDDVMDAISALYTEEHDYKTCIVDSLDWLEPLVWEKTCQEGGTLSIEEFGYGKGYVEAMTQWRRFFQGITALRDDRGMTTIMIAHSQIVRVEDPTLPAYDTHDLKLHKRASAIAEEFADIILFAAVQTSTITEEVGFNNKRTRAVTTGARIMHTVGAPAYTAKNRYSIASPLPLTWDALSEAMGYTATQPEKSTTTKGK